MRVSPSLRRVNARVAGRHRREDAVTRGWFAGRPRPFAAVMLRDARVARLATADAQATPHVIPICFVFDGRAIYTAIDEKPKRTGPRGLRRVRNILANPRVAVVVDQYEEDWRRLRYVLVRGTATIIDRGPDHRRAIARLRAKYRQYRTMRLETRPVLKISPLTIAAWAGDHGEARRAVSARGRR